MTNKMRGGADQTFDLAISEFASRTGISAGALRTWESRHGFPRPQRLAGGHRRYHVRDVDAVREVLRRRSAGQTTSAAIAAVVARLTEPAHSIFAGLRHARPDLAVHVIDKPTMLA
ncbi:MAG: MerR family transcriptional regulator, partial [Actinomycetia bacterium]|nr:MerR family transcriptional regulator [Actinomycetes bacterium]